MPDETFSRIGLLGHGAIGSVVAQELGRGRVAGATLAAVYVPSDAELPLGVSSVDELIESCDLIVECAGHGALASHGKRILEEGRDLLVSSVGALADDQLRKQLWATGNGRILISTGAIGGLDTLRALSLGGGIDVVQLTTTKPPTALIQDWMEEETIAALRSSQEPVLVFEGTARDAAISFPKSLNVAATVALATAGFDSTRIRLVGDSQSTKVHHVIEASGQFGSYKFSFQNEPSMQNERTSAIVPYAILAALARDHQRIVLGA